MSTCERARRGGGGGAAPNGAGRPTSVVKCVSLCGRGLVRSEPALRRRAGQTPPGPGSRKPACMGPTPTAATPMAASGTGGASRQIRRIGPGRGGCGCMWIDGPAGKEDDGRKAERLIPKTHSAHFMNWRHPPPSPPPPHPPSPLKPLIYLIRAKGWGWGGDGYHSKVLVFSMHSGKERGRRNGKGRFPHTGSERETERIIYLGERERERERGREGERERETRACYGRRQVGSSASGAPPAGQAFSRDSDPLNGPHVEPGLAGAPGRRGRGAPKSGAPGGGAGRCKKTGGAHFEIEKVHSSFRESNWIVSRHFSMSLPLQQTSSYLWR